MAVQPSSSNKLSVFNLQIDTKNLDGDLFDVSLSSLSGSPQRSRGRSFSQAILPALRLSSPSSPKAPAQSRTGHSRSYSAQTTDPNRKYRDESRKLLAHVLIQLHNRPKPPSVFDDLRTGGGFALEKKQFGPTVTAVRDALKLGKNRKNTIQRQASLRYDESDSDEEVEIFSTDLTFYLMTQLVSALVAMKGSWRVFDDEHVSEDPHRTSLKTKNQPSGPPSSSGASTSLQGSELLSLTISIISSVISEDCRFQVSSPRPSRPPNSLQSVVLDVASYLSHMLRHNPKVLSQIGLAVLPAFYTFRRAMYLRLLAFFEDIVIRPMLDSLRQAQGAPVELQAQVLGPDLDGNDVSSIQINVEADEESKPIDTPRWKPWSSSSTKSSNILSSNAPSQSLAIYYLSSIIPSFLGAVLENIDITRSEDSGLPRFHTLFGTIVDRKPDAYLDVLEVIAYHSPRVRHAATALLASYWPKGLGHGIIAKSLPVVNSSNISHSNGHKEHYDHHFVPWRFIKPPEAQPLSASDCWVCAEPISDFGLLCPFCFCAVHFNCYDYPDGSSFSQYSALDSTSERIAVHRFCHVSSPRRHRYRVIQKASHSFRLVNIFTLSLCFLCKEPLWGSILQGLKCTSCHHFVHSSCLSRKASSDFSHCGSEPTDASCVVITWTALRHSFVDHYKDFVFKLDQLSGKTYEDISVLSAALWTQLQILHNGTALGSIVINQDKATKGISGNKQLDEFGLLKFELHYLVQLYESYLSSGNPAVSSMFNDYFEENNMMPKKHLWCFDWPALVYLTTSIKSPTDTFPVTTANSPALLSVSQPEGLTLHSNQQTYSTQSYEVASLAHIRDVLGVGFDILTDSAARHLMSHLQSLGFLELMDLEPLWQGEDASANYEMEYCTFPLPLGLDQSNEAETLVSAIEACLSDLDLSINEAGLLLLVRRFPYDCMMTPNALMRLGRSVLSWILSEDDSLATILREYVPKGQTLPGVRSQEGQPWPAGPTSRRSPGISFNNGRVYIDYRRDLLTRYAARWMCSFHDRDPSSYADVLFQLSADLAEETGTDNLVSEDAETQTQKNKVNVDRHLRFLIKLGQSSVAFSVFDDIFSRWLELTTNNHRLSYPALIRLFTKEQDGSSRSNTAGELAAMQNDVDRLPALNPWRIIMQTSSASKQGLRRGLRWLCVLACSGVDIPPATFAEFLSLTKQFDSSWEESSLLIEALFSSVWLRSSGRQELQSIVSSVHSRICAQVLAAIGKASDHSKILCLVRQSLSICLLLYGCERDDLLSMTLVQDVDICELPSRRKLNSRGRRHQDNVGVDSVFISALWSYVQADVEEITILAGMFFSMLMNGAQLLESFEIDNVILRNSDALTACAWAFYGIQRPELTMIRSGLLVRLLVVDTEPFQTLWEAALANNSPWEKRLETVLRLFRIILDIKSPTFQVEDRQWRSNVIDVFYYYFSAGWADKKGEIRLAVNTWSQTLLSAHLEAISECWNETLANSPVADRAKLVAFLIQLIPHFPHWQVLSWSNITEALLEDDYAQRMADDGNGPASAHLSMYGLSSKDTDNSAQEKDQDSLLLRTSLLLLSLQMICHKIPIDLFSLLRIKRHLVQSFGFKDVVEVPSTSGQAFYVQYGDLEHIPDHSVSCLDEIMNVLDVYYPFDIAPSAMGGHYANDDIKTSLFIGSVFVDVLLSVLNESDLESLPFITLKNLLKCLMIIAYKHDLESGPLRHLQNSFRKAVRRVINLFMVDVSYEIRQLALSACQTCIRKWPNMVGTLIYDSLETAAKLIVSLNHSVEDELVSHASSFIETVLTLFSSHGVFNTLCRRHLDRSFFVVLQKILDHNAANSSSEENLRDLLLQDTLSRAVDNDVSVFQTVLENLSTYVEVVHHSGYDASLMQFVGHSLANITHRTIGWPYNSFECTPLLLMSSTLIQHNQARSRELFTYLENMLRTTLSKFHASAESLRNIFQVTSMIYKRYRSQNQSGDSEQSTNKITMAILETLSDGLRGRTRVPTSTLTSIIEVVVETQLEIPTSDLTQYAEDGVFYLLTFSMQDMYSQNDFAASEAAGKLVSLLADRDLPSLRRIFPTMITDRPGRASYSIRAWNFLVLEALKNKSPAFSGVLTTNFQLFASSFQMSLGYYHSGLAINALDSAAADINMAYVALKLWLLIVQKDSDLKGQDKRSWINFENGSDNFVQMIWNELWPPFQRIVTSFEKDALEGNVSPVAILAWSSVADLFLFLRQAHITTALENSSQLALLNRLGPFIRDSSKFTRVARSISMPPEEVPFDVLVNQAANDMLAAEKLHALDSMKKERAQA